LKRLGLKDGKLAFLAESRPQPTEEIIRSRKVMQDHDGTYAWAGSAEWLMGSDSVIYRVVSQGEKGKGDYMLQRTTLTDEQWRNLPDALFDPEGFKNALKAAGVADP
jgi:hypothetical protein